MTRSPAGPLLVGVDLGSQSAKVAVHTADGRVVASGRRPLRAALTPRPGVVEHPDDDLVDALAAACRDAVAALSAAGGSTGDLVGLGLCGIRSTRALLRADGTLAAPVISWMDERASRPHDPAAAPADTAVVTASSGHLTRWLTGRAADSPAAYPVLWPLDLERWDWSTDDAVLAAMGLRRDQLVALALPGAVLGAVTEVAAHATGLPAGLPVVATANDKAVEALGCGLAGPDQALVSLGTYVAPMLLGDAPLRPGEEEAAGAWTNLASVPGRYLLEGGGVRRGMWTVSWLRDLVGPGLLPGGAPEELEDVLNRAAAEVPVGADGLLAVLDWLAPAHEPWRRGAFVGFDGRHGAAHLYRAVLEGLALTVGGHLRTLVDGLDRDVRLVLLSGGGARSPLMRQVVADVTGLPVRVAVDDGSPAALGAAVCAAVGTGVHPGFDEAVAAMVAPGPSVQPDAAATRAYGEIGQTHADLRASLAPVLRRDDAPGQPR
ncbi:FGGY-family carbohydrate kinase [Nocardioides aquaticus]|uniref:FGGY-family carbohydrate kinase n=1 Tax=Nocardioides aquaticus TaxID=160826 RepID=UPI0031E3CDA8